MHQHKMRFADRVTRVAQAAEVRGVRGTYVLHERYLSNRSARRRFGEAKPSLDGLQQRLVDELDRDGFALTTAADLLGAETWTELYEAGTQFTRETAEGLALEKGGAETALRRRSGKEFVVRGHSYGVDLDLDDPWFRAGISHRMLDIANAYLRLLAKLEYVDTWYSVPQPEDASRVSSQRWHRDFNDRHLLKAFLYLVDVNDEMGPFQYVAGSAGDGPYAKEWAWQPLGRNYPDEGELEQRIPESAVQTFTGPAGTFLLCNTSGFHRGGFTTTDARVLATWTYSSPASLASLTTRSYTYTGPAGELDDVQRFAVS